MDLLQKFSKHLDYHQTTAYARVMGYIHWDAIPICGAYLYVKRIGPVSFAKLQRPANIDLEKLRELARKLNIVQLFVEPALEMRLNGKTATEEKKEQLMREGGFYPTDDHHAYTKTLICDISGSEPSVFKTFSKTMQYQMRKSEMVGATYTRVPFGELCETQKKEILELHSAWSKERKVMGYPDDFIKALWRGFSDKGEMILAKKDNQLHGALFLLLNGPIGMYFYQFSSLSGRSSLYVPSGLAHQGILAAKKHGCSIFDLCSCYDERYPNENLKWRGFSEHKLRFHPTPVYYPSAFVSQFHFGF